MKSEKMELKKAKRKRRTFSSEEKSRMVLSVWAERRSVAELCRENSVSREQFWNWQDLALQGILNALEMKRDQVKCPPLGDRLSKLLERKASIRAQLKGSAAESRSGKPEENAVQKGE